VEGRGRVEAGERRKYGRADVRHARKKGRRETLGLVRREMKNSSQNIIAYTTTRHRSEYGGRRRKSLVEKECSRDLSTLKSDHIELG